MGMKTNLGTQGNPCQIHPCWEFGEVVNQPLDGACPKSGRIEHDLESLFPALWVGLGDGPEELQDKIQLSPGNHLVGFIQYQKSNKICAQVPGVNEVKDPTRRSDDNVNSLLHALKFEGGSFGKRMRNRNGG